MDKHYWKDAYKEFWETASQKEAALAKLIEIETGFKVEDSGLGANSSEFITGSAQDNNYEKGDADLFVVEKNCFIEVTGPNIKMAVSKPLWLRPDKLRNTYKKRKRGIGDLHVAAHFLTKYDDEVVVRVVRLDDLFFDHLIERKSFPKVNPIIRGRREEYYEIPAKHETIISLKSFIETLKK